VLDDLVAFVADAKHYAALGITQLDVIPTATRLNTPSA
jgi:hypothetical protein